MPLPALLNYRKNVRSVERELDSREIITRAYPKGAAEDGYALTMADHRWEVVGINGNKVFLGADAGGSPIRFDDQLNGLYARKWSTGAQWLVTDTNFAQQWVTLEDVPDTLSVGHYIQFRDSSGNELVYLDHPASQASYGGVFEGVVEREDVPNVDNLAPNAFLDSWTGSTPDDFQTTATVTQYTGTAFRQFGRFSAQVQMSGGFSDLITMDPFTIYPTAERPYFTFQAALFITRGAVTMEVILHMGNGSIVVVPDPNLDVTEDVAGQDGVRNNTFRKLNVWTYAGIGGLNLYDDPITGSAKQVRIRFYSDTDAEFYLDAVMITQTAGGSELWYDRLASNALWHAANDALETKVGEPVARYKVQPLDLFREDPDAFSFDELVQGGSVRVRDYPLGIDVTTRIQELRRDLTEDGQNVTDIELTNQDRRLSQDVNRTATVRPRTTATTQVRAGKQEITATDGALSSLTVTVNGTQETLTWAHNQIIQDDGASRFTIDIRSTKGGVLATARNPKWEAAGSDTIARTGSFATTVTLGGGSNTVNVYTVTLKDAGAVVATYQVSPAARLYA